MMDSGAIVRLNIGGKKFCTTASTLCGGSSENFFHSLLNGKIPSTKDEKGRYFIDRDGKLFEPILSYLRTGMLEIPAHISEEAVRREADFYLIPLPPPTKRRSPYILLVICRSSVDLNKFELYSMDSSGVVQLLHKNLNFPKNGWQRIPEVAEEPASLLGQGYVVKKQVLVSALLHLFCQKTKKEKEEAAFYFQREVAIEI